MNWIGREQEPPVVKAPASRNMAGGYIYPVIDRMHYYLRSLRLLNSFEAIPEISLTSVDPETALRIWSSILVQSACL